MASAERLAARLERLPFDVLVGLAAEAVAAKAQQPPHVALIRLVADAGANGDWARYGLPSLGTRLTEAVDVADDDLCDRAALKAVLDECQSERGGEPFASCVHFAGLKAVGESVAKPLFYYENNIAGTVNLFNVMEMGNWINIVFWSSVECDVFNI